MLNGHKHYDLSTWIEFTQLKCIREYKEQELEAFKKPFYAGWKRELSIRAQLHSSGKRIVDIYYISPCNQHKLKSYIELGFYLKNAQDQKLEPENFTFAKQPVFKYPEEVIKQVLKTTKQIRAEQSRHHSAVASGEPNGHPQMPQLTPIRSDSNRSGSDSLNNSLNSVAEGRSKRKRTAPTRFDDEEYFEQGVLTKRKMPRSPGELQQQPMTIKIPKSALTPLTPKSKDRQPEGGKTDNSAEDRESICSFKSFKSSKSGRSEQQSSRPSNAPLDTHSNLLLNNENSETVDSNLKDLDDDSNLSLNKNENSQDQLQSQQQAQPTEPPPASKSKSKKKKPAAKAANPELSLMNSLLENSLLMETYNSLGINSLLQNGNFECEDNDLLDCEFVVDTKKSADQQLPIPPCSLVCLGRKADMPSLICSRCLCLYHPQCVRSGVFLRGTKKFVCPNCVLSEDQLNAVEDPSKLFENPPDIEEQSIEAEAAFAEAAQAAQVAPQPSAKPQQQPKEKPVNQSNSAAKLPPKMQINFANTFPKMNGGSEHQQQHQQQPANSKKKAHPQSQQHLPAQIRLPTQPVRILNTNQHTVMSANLSKKLNHLNLGHQQMNPNLFVNQMSQHQQLMRQNRQLNEQLIWQKLSKYSAQRQDLINLRSSFSQLTNSRGNMSLSSRQTHLDSMNKNILNSQKLLDSFKSAASTHPNQAPSSSFYPRSMSMQNANQQRANSRHVGHQQRVGKQAYSEREKKLVDYLNQKQNGLKLMVNQSEALDKIFDYLTVRDLIRCRLVNKTFNRLASNKQHWKRLSLKNLAVKDWEYFGSEIVDTNQVEELCLEGLRLPTKTAEQTESDLEDDLWSGFRSCYEYFQSLNKLSLGRISTQQLSRLLSNEEQLVNPLFALEELSIRNLYDQSGESSFCSLKLFKEKIGEFKRLKLLRIESKQGISNDDYTISLLNNLSETLPDLRSLYLPSLKGFSIENFEFLTKLNQLECLEIGSCESWTLGENANQEEDGDDARMDHDGGSLLNETDRLDEDEFLNENQENEFNHFGGPSRSSPKRHRGAFKYLSQLRNLKQLYLTDVIIDEMSNQLPLVVEKMRDLESLGLGYVTVSPEATQTLNMLCNTLKNKLTNLKQFSISTDDPQTNRSAFDLLLKRLDNLEELRWKVHTQVEDDGNCLVPFAKERGIESDLDNEEDLTMNNEDCIEMVETCYLNDVLQQNLKRTKVYILPQ